MDYANAPLAPEDRALLDYALKLTRTPAAVSEEDVQRLREHGFDDRAILDACQVAAYYNYVNRLADGLGVELEDDWREEDLTVTKEAWARRGRGERDAGP